MNQLILRISPFILLAFILLLLISCEGGSSDPDLLSRPEVTLIEVSPDIETLEICGEDDPYAIGLNSGDSLILKFNLEAVNGLSAYKIDIHGNFDCHSHGRVAESVPWKVLITKDVEGTDVTITEKLPVPLDVQAGDYHFMFQALDLLGNVAEWIPYSLKVQNDGDTDGPEVQLINPQSGSLIIAKEEPVEIELKISDNEALSGGRVDVTYTNSSGTEFTAEQYFFSDTDGSESIYDFAFNFPASASSGDYQFLFTVYDAVGNTTEAIVEVEVS